MPKKIMGVLLVVLLLLALPMSVGALSVNSVPYTTYDYNFYQESISAPAGYIVDRVITGESLGLENFSTPTDIYYDNKDSVYLLDSGNGRVIVLDTELKLKTVLDNFRDKDGYEISFEEAEGLTVGADGRVYIADTVGERILVFYPDMTLQAEIGSPEDDAHLEEGLPFDPIKVMVDNRNNMYVIARSNNMGAFVFNSDFEYLRFFGGNNVTQTAEVVLKYMLRPFLTQAQLEAMTTSTPISISSFDCNEEGFVYTSTVVTNTTKVPAGAVRKLNYLGENVLSGDIVFGDLEWDRRGKGSSQVTNILDLDVDADGFINMLDSGRGKVFQYTERGEMIAVFGSYGTQVGTFTNPQALESVKGNVIVVDKDKNNLTVFRMTNYGNQYRDAIVKLENDDFSGSLAIWNMLLEENSNNAHAYYGIGRVHDMQGNYGAAMKNFKLAGDRMSYSESFQEYRGEMIKKWFIPIVITIVVLVVGTKVIGYLRRKKAKVRDTASAYSKLESKYTFPLYTLFHPADGFQQLKPRKIGSWRVVGIILAILFVVFTLEYFVTGYIFNTNRFTEYSLPIMVLKTVGIALLFVIANWAVCTLFNGNGNLKEIACVTTYSLVPLIAALFIKVVASNFLTASEGALMNIVLTIGVLWTFLLLMCGLSAIHEYNITQTFFSAIATVLGMAVIVFLLIMFFSLLQQTSSFIQSIVIEAITRY